MPNREVVLSSREVVEHGIYRHFKGKYYLVEGIAKHSETGELMVVYRHLYGDRTLCVRPADMFLSEVDQEKYPDVKQKYRFEEVEEYAGHADTQDALMSAVWASCTNFSEGQK